MLKKLLEIIDEQSIEKLKNYLNENPNIELNNITETGASVLWWAITPPIGKSISEQIIQTLLNTNRINLKQKFYEQSIRSYCPLLIYRMIKEHFSENDSAADTVIVDSNPRVVETYPTFPYSVTTPSVVENLDLRGIDLSAVDLKNISFKNCDLRLTNILSNKELNEHHLCSSTIETNFPLIAAKKNNLKGVEIYLTLLNWEKITAQEKNLLFSILHQSFYHNDQKIAKLVLETIAKNHPNFLDFLSELDKSLPTNLKYNLKRALLVFESLKFIDVNFKKLKDFLKLPNMEVLLCENQISVVLIQLSLASEKLNPSDFIDFVNMRFGKIEGYLSYDGKSDILEGALDIIKQKIDDENFIILLHTRMDDLIFRIASIYNFPTIFPIVQKVLGPDQFDKFLKRKNMRGETLLQQIGSLCTKSAELLLEQYLAKNERYTQNELGTTLTNLIAQKQYSTAKLVITKMLTTFKGDEFYNFISPTFLKLTHEEFNELIPANYRLIVITEKIMANIRGENIPNEKTKMTRHRYTHPKNDTKTTLLSIYSDWLKQNSTMNEDSLQFAINLLHSICEKKRHTLHFWAKPDSAKELPIFLQHYKIRITPSVFASKEVRTIRTIEDIDALFERFREQKTQKAK